MRDLHDTRLGVMFRREHPPETLPDFALQAEDAGFDELWVVEDCFYTSGVAAAASALATTDAITVGLGIMPAVVRNPVFMAMEIATLARIYPGRFLPGIGHGVGSWMRQIGAFPSSQMTALEEVTIAVRALLTGEPLTLQGGYVQIEDAALIHPPEPVPPISLGVTGPKSLALSGQVADGTILSEYSSPAYVTWARETIAEGQREADLDRDHRLTVFAFACAAESTEAARRQLRPMVASALASRRMDAKLAPMGLLPQIRALREAGGQACLEAEMPDAWIDHLTLAGTPEDWNEAIGRLVDAGAETVVVVPMPDRGVDELDRFIRHLGL